MDLTEYRASAAEMQRTGDLLRLLPSQGRQALDVGARDGHFSLLLADKFDVVTALDLQEPKIIHPRIQCVKGDVTGLTFDNNVYDLVFCAEVLEHIPSHALGLACSELGRVCKKSLLIGVPYKQDIRVGRMTCITCGGKNPPWGHVNSFDEVRLKSLFPEFDLTKVSYVGEGDPGTNCLASWLMDLAGNPYGTYGQEEPCVHCGAPLKVAPARNTLQKMATKAAAILARVQNTLSQRHANWIHCLFERK